MVVYEANISNHERGVFIQIGWYPEPGLPLVQVQVRPTVRDGQYDPATINVPFTGWKIYS